MEIVCPACNRVNTEEPHCGRCGADLLALVQIRRSADLALKTGTRCLKQNDVWRIVDPIFAVWLSRY